MDSVLRDQKVLRGQAFSLRVGVIVMLALALASCGRKGPLELPANAPPVTPSANAAQARVLPTSDNPGLIQPPNKFVDKPASEKLDQAARNPSKPINAPPADSAKPFILDPLL